MQRRGTKAETVFHVPSMMKGPWPTMVMQAPGFSQSNPIA